MAKRGKEPLRIFVAFASADRPLKDHLLKHVSVLHHLGRVLPWSVDDVLPGDDWRRSLEAALSTADLALLLISANFFAADLVRAPELRLLLERYTAGLPVIPILLRPCAWELHNWVGKLAPLPKDRVALSKLSESDLDQACCDIANELDRRSSASAKGRLGRPSLSGKRRRATPTTGSRSGDAVAIGARTPVPDLGHHIVPIYRAFSSLESSELDWYRQFEASVTQRHPALESKLLYCGPGLAKNWIALDGDPFSDCGISAFGNALDAAMATLGHPAELEVVDIGVGSGGKARACLRELVRLHSVRRAGYVAVDISYDLLFHAVESLFRSGEPTEAYGRVLALNADFNNLRGYKDLLVGGIRRLFLFLGATLGNEPDEFRTLNSIRRMMGDGDVLLLELQLLEDNPFTDEELTAHIRRTGMLQFCRGPFESLGCEADSIVVSVHGEDNESSRRGVDARTYIDICTFSRPVQLQNPFFRDNPLLLPRRIPVYVARKYLWPQVRKLPEDAGFEVLDYVEAIGRDQRRRYVYLILRRAT